MDKDLRQLLDEIGKNTAAIARQLTSTRQRGLSEDDLDALSGALANNAKAVEICRTILLERA